MCVNGECKMGFCFCWLEGASPCWKFDKDRPRRDRVDLRTDAQQWICLIVVGCNAGKLEPRHWVCQICTDS